MSDAEASPGGLRRLFRLVYDKLVRPIFGINDSPHSVALGVAVGLFVAFTPTVGVQIPIAFGIGTLLKANRIVAVALTWISNVVTMLPFYYLYYVVGLFVLGRDGLSYSELTRRFGEGGGSPWEIGKVVLRDLGLPLWIGSLIIAVAVAVPSYPLARRALERRAARRAAAAVSPEVEESDS